MKVQISDHIQLSTELQFWTKPSSETYDTCKKQKIKPNSLCKNIEDIHVQVGVTDVSFWTHLQNVQRLLTTFDTFFFQRIVCVFAYKLAKCASLKFWLKRKHSNLIYICHSALKYLYSILEAVYFYSIAYLVAKRIPSLCTNFTSFMYWWES